MIQLPWVSRLAFDQAILRAEAAEKVYHAAIEESRLNVRRADEAARIGLMEARLSLKQAVEMAQLASRAMFGGPTDHETPSSTSVAEFDRRVTAERQNR